MEQIKRYIEFARKNGFDKIDDENYIIDNGIIKQFDGEYCSNIEHCIMKKDFIESIARGVGYEIFDNYWDKEFFASSKDYITYYQAIAIRDGKLDEFIKNILPNE